MYLKLSLLIMLSMNLAMAGVVVKGQLKEKGTRTPLSEVNVYILPHKLKATTDKEGKFLFPDVPEGEFEFIVNNTGYIRLKEKSSTIVQNQELYIEKEYYDVFETVVTGLGNKKDVTKKSLSTKEFLKAPGAQEDPVRAVQNLPGVANQQFSSAIVIQGSEPDDTSYTLNGHEIPLVFHFGGLTSVVTPTAIGSVDYLASGYGPEYGRALGGIINLNTRAPKTDRWHGEGFLDITKLGALAEGPINEKSSLLISGRISYIGRVIEAIAEEMDDFAVTAAPEFKDFYVNYDYKISEDENFNMIALASQDTLGFIIKEGNDPNIEGNISNNTNFFRLIPRYIKKIDAKNSFDISLGYGEDNIQFTLGDRFFDLDTEVFSQRFEWEHKYSQKLTSYLGVDSQFRTFNVGVRLPTINNSGGVGTVGGDEVLADIEGSNTEIGLYLRNSYKYNEKWTLSPNLRLDYFDAVDELYLSPRANAIYSYDSTTDFNFAYGLYYQAPQNGEASAEFGNAQIVSEKSHHLFASVVKDFRGGSSQGLKVDLGGFYKDLDNIIIQTNEVRSDGTPVQNTNEGTGTVYGLQLQASYNRGPYTFLSAYTYLQSRRRDPENGEYPSEFDQTHNLNLIGVYEKSRWSYAVRLRYVTGGPYTPVVDSTYDSDRDVYLPTRGRFFSDRFEDFVQLDFRIDRKFVYKLWILSAYLDIQNITNSANGQGISYNYDFSESEPAQGLPLLPIIGLRGEF
jgi:hypothetical protein